ncbi:GDSL esterase/lipase 1-like protein [Tanacetum coccineum]|uniref:GDSL esterase/lipase 1-like protein n=1 Tax=Tanacetum coccineum TaxID=301880 RepID=A0ABQ5F0D7_9ASTR
MTAASSKSGFLVLFIFCLSVTTDSWGAIDKRVAVFVFGDSLFDPGNNNYINTTTSYQANFWPYGESYFTPPIGRFSNGRLIPDFIAEYAGLPLIPPYLEPGNNEFTYGANFASAGAGALIDTRAGFVVDIQTQLRYLGDVEKNYRDNLGNTEAQQLLSSAIYLFSCGANDYGTFVDNNLSIYHSFTDEQYTDIIIGNLTNIIKGIYAKGGRKFRFLTVPLSGFKDGETACCGSGPFRGNNGCGGMRGIKEYELCDNVNEFLIFDSAHPNEQASQ